MAARRRTTARAAVLPARRALPEFGPLTPSLRSVAAGLLVMVLAAGAYVGARDTSVFAVRTIDVQGGTPALRDEVRSALADEAGTSLLKVGGASVAARVSPIPELKSFTVDRAFPHTLRVVVKREVPVLVVRRVPGNEAFLVAASGKVIKTLPHPRLSSLPRLWVKKDVPVTVGSPLPSRLTAAATALSTLRGAGLPTGVAAVRVGVDELTLTLGSGFEVRLGDPGDMRLKLAIARRVLRATSAAVGGSGYVDVSVPLRPVLSTDSQVGG
ncbi:MAG: cell division protein FtsQ/DivIB [Gaiellaceae bacterium]